MSNKCIIEISSIIRLIYKTNITNQNMRKTIDFNTDFYDQIKAYGEARGCKSFSEIVRDIVRTVIHPIPSHKDANETQNNNSKQPPSVGG